MACFIINRSPSTAIDCRIPEEVWTGKPVDYSMLRIFGCPAYVHVQSEQRSKLDSKSKQCIFLGYEKGVKGFKLWDPTSHKVVLSRDVVLDESHMMKSINMQDDRMQVYESDRERSSIQVELNESETPEKEESSSSIPAQ